MENAELTELIAKLVVMCGSGLLVVIVIWLTEQIICGIRHLILFTILLTIVVATVVYCSEIWRSLDDKGDGVVDVATKIMNAITEIIQQEINKIIGKYQT